MDGGDMELGGGVMREILTLLRSQHSGWKAKGGGGVDVMGLAGFPKFPSDTLTLASLPCRRLGRPSEWTQ